MNISDEQAPEERRSAETISRLRAELDPSLVPLFGSRARNRDQAVGDAVKRERTPR